MVLRIFALWPIIDFSDLKIIHIWIIQLEKMAHGFDNSNNAHTASNCNLGKLPNCKNCINRVTTPTIAIKQKMKIE